MLHPVPTLGMRFESNGAALAYSADTAPTDELDRIGRAADLLLAEATWLEPRPQAGPMHMTAAEAGERAAAAEAGRLILDPRLAVAGPRRGGAAGLGHLRRHRGRRRRRHAGGPVTLAAARTDGRAPADLRPLVAELGYLEWAEGSVLLSVGKTRVLAAASYEPKVPKFLAGSGTGWVTAEYSMLPRSTSVRTQREVQAGRPSGRTQEIQRLVGRSLRSVIALERLGECTFWIDCDVLQADGGTRTASITAGYLALAQAVGKLAEGRRRAGGRAGRLRRRGERGDRRRRAAARPVLRGGRPGRGRLQRGDDRIGELVEVQGTAEGRTFSRAQLDHLLDLAAGGIRRADGGSSATLLAG